MLPLGDDGGAVRAGLAARRADEGKPGERPVAAGRGDLPRPGHGADGGGLTSEGAPSGLVREGRLHEGGGGHGERGRGVGQADERSKGSARGRAFRSPKARAYEGGFGRG